MMERSGALGAHTKPKVKSSKHRHEIQLACDILLCLIVAASCAYVAAGGFYIDWRVQTDPLLLGILPLALISALVFGWHAGIARGIAGGSVFAFVAILAISWAILTAQGSSPIADEEANATIFVILIVVFALVVFLLSRTTAGLVALAALVVLEVGSIEFLYHHSYIAASIIALASLVALFMFSRMRIAYERMSRDGESSTDVQNAPGHTALLGIACATLAILIATGVASAIAASVNPPTASLKLFTEKRAFEEIEVESTMDIQQVPDENLASDLLDSTIDSSAQGQKDSAAGEDARSAPSPTSAFGQMLQSAFNPDTIQTDFKPISYDYWRLLWMIVPLLVIMAIVAVIVARRYLRRRWILRYIELSPSEQALAAYDKMAHCLRVMGLSRNSNETVQEYYARNEHEISGLFAYADQGASLGSTFGEMVCGFEQVRYGGLTPNAEQTCTYANLYRNFPTCARRQLGALRYLLKFLRI